MFVATRLSFVVPTPPAYLSGKELDAAHEALDSALFRVLPRLSGVLVEYSNVKMLGPGECVDDQIDVLFHYAADVVVFQPEPETEMQCVVTEWFSNHIALTAMGAFRVVVRAENISNGLKFNPKKNAWTSASHELARNSVVAVHVVRLVGANLAWQIEGAMRA